MFSKDSLTKDYKSLAGSLLIIGLLGGLAELMRFMKWYITIRKRVTNNCLQPMLKNVNSLTDVDDEATSDRLDHLDEYELTLAEKAAVTLFFVGNRAVQLACAIQIMISYHVIMVFVLSFGMAVGNFLFAGLIQD
jgi:hypothetical protein